MTSARLIKFRKHQDLNGALCSYECGQEVPFDIRRVFTVAAKEGDLRGDHAHKRCTQLLVCVHGKIRVKCDDGQREEEFLLDDLNVGLLVPPGVWARQEYLAHASVLMVLCDRGYEVDDYMREYIEFKAFVESGK